MEILRNISLKENSTYKIGGKAVFFCIANGTSDILEAVKYAKDNNLDLLPIGGASNILFSDNGYSGLVLKIANKGINILKEKDEVVLQVSAGTNLAELISFASDNNLTGLEWGIGIPGTVGGAIVNNAGIKDGASMSDCIIEVSAVSVKDSVQNIFLKENCNFSYRSSLFKGNNDYVIIDAKIILKKSEKDLIKVKEKEILEKRLQTQPYNLPSAGSVFKNPLNFSAGKLIEECGLKGKQIGGAQISTMHGNFIVNTGDATEKDVKDLINLIKETVKIKFNIFLEEEIEFF